uniref:Uncharacterized protein n=1 Tax=Tetranychus urticae TaxID=32264 RepID=T1K8K8_TETUR
MSYSVVRETAEYTFLRAKILSAHKIANNFRIIAFNEFLVFLVLSYESIYDQGKRVTFKSCIVKTFYEMKLNKKSIRKGNLRQLYSLNCHNLDIAEHLLFAKRVNLCKVGGWSKNF